MKTAAPDRGNRPSRLVDPRTLMGIRNLQLRAKVVVEGFWSGIHRSPYHGFSVEFSEYRPFAPGDDPRYLDWKVLARSDRLFIKKFEDETNVRCTLLIDQSRSMSYGSLTYSKADYAATLAATLAYFLHLQGDGVGLIVFDDQVREYLPPRHRVGHLKHLMHALDRPATGRATGLAAPLDRAASLIRKRSLVVVISDFLTPLEDLRARLVPLCAAGHDVIVFQVLDPAEVKFPFDESATFEDLESGRTLLLEPDGARGGYLQRFERHNKALQQVCEGLGLAFRQQTTDQALELALFDFVRARMQQGRRAHQRGVP